MVVAATYYAPAIAHDERQYEWVLPHPYKDDDASNYRDYLIKTSSQLLAQKYAGLVVENCALFDLLVEQWHAERGVSSFLTDIVACPAYQKIIALGKDSNVVELILKRLRSEGDDPDHWFWALHILTGANPVADEDEGNLQEMAKAWLEWGTASGYAS